MELITRAEAKRRGLNRYYNGLTCGRGHVVERYVSNSTCVQCHNERAARIISNRRARVRVEREATRPILCEVCGGPQTNKGVALMCQDHCHVTGKLRGFLCASCNSALGHAKDSPKLLRKLADYLDRWSQAW